MNDRKPFFRKLAYLSVIVVLLLFLSWLSPPATSGSGSSGGSEGGQLARLRKEHGLSQANLGEIDPSSEALKLATFGMRGVAANVLWTKAFYYQKTRDWSNLSATLKQIIKLQPNFVAVWRFQGWNLAYNVSQDWDGYKDRYHWVIEGINFIKMGTQYNQREPILLWDEGWFIGHKLGRADERVQYRKLFREDDDFHGDRPVAQRDNWLVGKQSFLDAEQLVDRLDVPVKGMSPLLFRADAPKCQINYAAALEEDGTFGEVARVEWNKALRDWMSYGNRDIQHYDLSTYRLESYEGLLSDMQKLGTELEAIEPGLADRIRQEKLDALTSEEKATLDKPAQERTQEENQRVSALLRKLEIRPTEVAKRVAESRRAEAIKLAERAEELEQQVRTIDASRNIVNYIYWRTRCEAERMPEAIDARRQMYEGAQAFRDLDMEKSRDDLSAAFENWRKVLDKYPLLLVDGETAQLVIEKIHLYEESLRQLEEALPTTFVLQDLIDANKEYYERR